MIVIISLLVFRNNFSNSLELFILQKNVNKIKDIGFVGCSEEMDYLNVDDETLKELIIDNYEKQFKDEFTAEQFQLLYC